MSVERPLRVGIVGAGLIGSSILWSGDRAWGDRVELGAHDLDQALRGPVEDAGWQWLPSVTEAVTWPDVLFVAVPLRFYPEVLAGIERALNLRDPGRPLTITDVGSQKAGVAELVNSYPNIRNRCEVVLGHPMAGTEFSGFDAGFDGLFDGCTWVLCPDLEPTTAAFTDLIGLILGLGARISVLGAGLHDQVVAKISHVPYALAAAEALLVGESPSRETALRLAAGSFSDVTRVAGSPPDLSVSLLSGNSEAVVKELDRVLAILEGFRNATALGDTDELYRLFGRAREARVGFLEARGSMERDEIVVEPGSLITALMEICEAGGLVHDADQGDAGWLVRFEPPGHDHPG